MRVSLNEIETRYAKAIEALGLPGGLAWDAAQIVMWHDLWGLDGAARLAARLDRLDGCEAPRPDVTVHLKGLTLQAAGSSLLAIGPAALDLLEAAEDEKDFAVEVRACRDLDLAAGLAGLAAMRGLDMVVEAERGESRLCAGSFGAATALHSLAFSRQDAAAAGTLLLRKLPPDAWTAFQDEAVLPPGELDARRAAALAEGVVVEGTAWRRILALTARWLVADTAESRARGAGGGRDTD